MGQGYFIEDLEAGMSSSFAKTVTEADILMFSGVSGDTNPVHLNQDYASSTMFKGRIAHGLLSASFISAVLGTRMPGPGCIYMSQNLVFRAPVRIGDTVNAVVTVAGIDLEKRRVTLRTVCSVGDTVVIEGEALTMVPSSEDIEPVAAE